MDHVSAQLVGGTITRISTGDPNLLTNEVLRNPWSSPVIDWTLARPLHAFCMVSHKPGGLPVPRRDNWFTFLCTATQYETTSQS